MKQINASNTGGFTLLVILGVIGFLLILLTGVFKVVLLELQDTRDMDHYLKSRSASEAGEEIALFQIKENGFGYDTEENYTDRLGDNPENGQSIMLSEVDDKSNFNRNKDTFFGYEIDSKTNNYTGMLDGNGGFQVIPLFSEDKMGKEVTTDVEVSLGPSVNHDDFVWNIIGGVSKIDPDIESGGVSGQGPFESSTPVNLKKLDSVESWDGQGYRTNFKTDPITVGGVSGFLNLSDENYLLIFNSGVDAIEYTITSNSSGESFTKPITTIYSSAKIGEIKQNIKLEIDNSQYFDVLKYSIYDS